MNNLRQGTQQQRPLNRNDYKTLALSALGGTLEFYDFVIFLFFALPISHLFFPPDIPEWMAQLQTMAIFAAGYLARPLGGIVIAHFGDRLGRKKMFALSVFLMAAPTLIIGLLPTYAAIGIAAPLLLLLMRILQGAAIGGEMPGAWVFVAEHLPRHHYGLGIGVLTSGITGGIFLGAIIAIVINRGYSPDEIHSFAWRIPFILGGVFGLVAVYLRRFLSETPVFQELAEQRARARELPLKTVIREHRQACLMTAGLTWALSTAVVVVILMTPAILQSVYNMPAQTALEANCIATLTLTAGCILFGWLEDRLGTQNNLIISWGGLILTAYWFYSQLPTQSALELTLNYGLVGLFCGAIVTTPISATRAFPPLIRYSGLSFAYNVSYAIFGGLTPVLTQFWLQNDPMAPAHYVSLTALVAILLAFTPITTQGWRIKTQPQKHFQAP